MLKIFLFLTLLCTYALASVSKDTKQQKRGIIGNDGWIGLSSTYGGYGQPWSSIAHTPWKGLPNLHAGLHLAHGSYGRGGIALTPGILKTHPVYITKHVVLEKPVPVPEPVIIEKPYHVPLPIEKIIHKPVPIPVPVPQAVPIPVKQPIAVPVQQPYPVPVRHPVPVPVAVPVPVPVHSLPPPAFPVHPLPPPALPLVPTDGVVGAIYARDYVPDHLYPVHSAALHLDRFSHGLGGHMLAHGYGHGYDYHDLHADHLAHGHDHKKRKTDKN